MLRHAGLNLPLSSAASSRSWGIGELPDIVELSAWMASAGFDRLLLLPLGTMAPGQASPYTATSAMSIDPLYIAVDALEDFRRTGGIESLSDEARDALTGARASERVEHERIRLAK